MRRLDRLQLLNEQGGYRNYSAGGDVERAVRQFLTNKHPQWFHRTQIGAATSTSPAKLENVLWRMLRRGDVQMKRDERGYLQWRAR